MNKIDEIKYILTQEERDLLRNAHTGEGVFLLGSPDEYIDLENQSINSLLVWDFIKKHHNVDVKSIINVLDTGFDIIDQHVPFCYLLAEYNNQDYPYLVAIKYEPWHSEEDEYFQISLVSSIKEATEVLEKYSCYYYSNSINSEDGWKWEDIKEKLLAYEEAKNLNSKLTPFNKINNFKNKL